MSYSILSSCIKIRQLYDIDGTQHKSTSCNCIRQCKSIRKLNNRPLGCTKHLPDLSWLKIELIWPLTDPVTIITRLSLLNFARCTKAFGSYCFVRLLTYGVCLAEISQGNSVVIVHREITTASNKDYLPTGVCMLSEFIKNGGVNVCISQACIHMVWQSGH